MSRRAIVVAVLTAALVLAGSVGTAATAMGDGGSGIALDHEEHETTIDGDDLALEAGPGQVIGGESELAAGSEVKVHLEFDDEAPARNESAVVTADGEFRAVFDLSDVPEGTSVRITVSRFRTVLDDANATVIECTYACDQQYPDDPAPGTELVYEGDELGLEKGPGRVIRGETSLPAGSEVKLVMEGDRDTPFYIPGTATVDADGTFQIPIDTSGNATPVGAEFEATIDESSGEYGIATVNGEIVECTRRCEPPSPYESDEPVIEAMNGKIGDKGMAVILVELNGHDAARLHIDSDRESGGFSASTTVRDQTGDGNVRVIFNPKPEYNPKPKYIPDRPLLDTDNYSDDSDDNLTIDEKSGTVEPGQYSVWVTPTDEPNEVDRENETHVHELEITDDHETPEPTSEPETNGTETDEKATEESSRSTDGGDGEFWRPDVGMLALAGILAVSGVSLLTGVVKL